MRLTRQEVLNRYAKRKEVILKNSGINEEITRKLLAAEEADKARDLRRLEIEER